MGILNRMMVAQDWRYFTALFLNIFPCLWILFLQGSISSRVAQRFGDPNPKLNGGYAFHPFFHVEPLGLLLFVTTGLGWGRWFPSKPSHFKNPVIDSIKMQGSGALLCFLNGFFFLSLASFLYHKNTLPFFLWFCSNTAVLSISFSVFQWIPLPYFHGFRILYPILPPSIGAKVMKYHPYLSLTLIVFLWSGLLQTPIQNLLCSFLIPCCEILQFPFSFIEYYFLS